MSLQLLRAVKCDSAGKSGSNKKDGNLEVAVQYSGPAVLPWLWEPVEQDGEIVLLPQAIPHIAGPSGMAYSLILHPSQESQNDSEMNM